MHTENITIDRRFRGPSDSGNGGYTAGLLASQLTGDVKVMLRSPPPLDVPLRLSINTAKAELFDGDSLVASAEQTQLDLAVPDCPSLSKIGVLDDPMYEIDKHVQPVCFVCGPKRVVGDGLRIFASPISDSDCVADVWTADQTLADDDGVIRPEFVWAALDCPGYFAHKSDDLMALLGTITASIKKRPKVGQKMIVVGWQIEVQGRKYSSGTALFSEQGELYAKSHQIWIALNRS